MKDLREDKSKVAEVERRQLQQWNSHEVKRTFRYDVAAATLFGAFNAALFYFPAVLIRREGAPTWLVALVVAGPSIGNFSAIFWSRITESIPRMRVMLIGGILARASLMLTLLAFNPFIFAPVIILSNILEISKSPAYAAIMQQVYPNDRRSVLMARVRVAASLATMIASAIMGQLLEGGDFRLVYAGAGLLGVLSILAFCQIHYYGTPSARPPTPLKTMLLIPRRDKRYGRFLAATFVLGFSNLMAAALYPLIAVDVLHVSNSFFGLLASITSAFSIVFYFIWGNYSDRHHPMVVSFICFVLYIINFLVYLIAADPLWLVIPAIINGISNAGLDLATLNNAIRFPKEREDVPHYMALYTTLVGVRGIIAPFLTSFLLIFVSLKLVLIVSLAIMILGSMNYFSVMRRLLRDPEFADPLATLPPRRRFFGRS